jgi:predicted RNA-binding Zn-ribbon protein involved in translation (DUF1610 family)
MGFAPRTAAAVMEPIYMTNTIASEPMPTNYSAHAAEQDNRPFENLNEAPVCPACGVPMVLHTEKHFLRNSTKLYICPNAPACTQTHAYEE